MKKLEMSDQFDCSPEEFWSIHFDPAFIAALDAEVGFKGREQLAYVDDDDKLVLRSRITPKGEVPPHIQQMVTNGMKVLQGLMGAGTPEDLPEPMKKMMDWGRSAFKDFLQKDPKEPAQKSPQLTMTYVEEWYFDRSKQELLWTVVPDLFKDVSQFKGVMKVVAEGSGCRRTIEGEFSLGIPGAGEKIEQFLVDEIGKGYAKAADLLRQWIEDNKEN